MLEILFLIWYTGKIGSIVSAKGRGTGGYKFLTVILWIGGELTGAVIGAAGGATGAPVYILALIGAAVGAGIAWAIANGVSPLPNAPQQMDASGSGGMLGLSGHDGPPPAIKP
jgi:hypothetical protein